MPPGQDTDWIGVEWIGRDLILMLVASAAIISVAGLWLFQDISMLDESLPLRRNLTTH